MTTAPYPTAYRYRPVFASWFIIYGSTVSIDGQTRAPLDSGLLLGMTTDRYVMELLANFNGQTRRPLQALDPHTAPHTPRTHSTKTQTKDQKMMTTDDDHDHEDEDSSRPMHHSVPPGRAAKQCLRSFSRNICTVRPIARRFRLIRVC